MAEQHSAAHRGGAVTLRCCAFCGVETAAWVHRLDWAKAQYRVYGKGHTWAGNVEVCDRCERLYRAGDDQTLVTVWQRTWEHSADDVRESIVNALIAFRDADLGVVSMSDWLPPGASEAATEGFVPLEDLLGEDWVGRQWPEQHRRALPENALRL